MKAIKYVLWREGKGYCEAVTTLVNNKTPHMSAHKLEDEQKLKHNATTLTSEQIKHYENKGFELIIIK